MAHLVCPLYPVTNLIIYRLLSLVQFEIQVKFWRTNDKVAKHEEPKVELEFVVQPATIRDQSKRR